MSRRLRAFPLFLAVALLPAACNRRKLEAVDAGPPVVAGAVLATFDVFAEGATTTYSERARKRLGLAKPVRRDVVVPMPAGLHLHVSWETRDDLVFAERYLTFAQLKVDHLDSGASCTVRHTNADPQERAPASGDPIRITLGVDYVCTEGRSLSSLGVPVGFVSAEGFQRIGLASGFVQVADASADAPAVTAIHFKPTSAALEPDAALVLDDFIKVLRADEALALCSVSFHGDAKTSPPLALQTKRKDVVRKYLVEHDVPEARVGGWLNSGQAPPATDDIELWPRETTCAEPKATRRR